MEGATGGTGIRGCLHPQANSKVQAGLRFIVVATHLNPYGPELCGSEAAYMHTIGYCLILILSFFNSQFKNKKEHGKEKNPQAHMQTRENTLDDFHILEKSDLKNAYI